MYMYRGMLTNEVLKLVIPCGLVGSLRRRYVYVARLTSLFVSLEIVEVCLQNIQKKKEAYITWHTAKN